MITSVQRAVVSVQRSGKTQGCRDLIVWQKAYSLVKEIYCLTRDFPPEEMHGLTRQIQRAAVSLPSNIAEGYGRQSKKEYQQFLSIANGSLCEPETQYSLAVDLGYVRPSGDVERLLSEVGKILYRLLHPLK